MSASDWEVCPFCVAAAMDIYPVDEIEAEDKYSTFREDYEFYGISNRRVCVSYRGRCSVCGASCEFDTSRDIDRGDR